MEIKYKILLATDYSEAVMNAERYAVQFAKSTNSTLVFLHVYEVPLDTTPTKVMDYVKTAEDWRMFEKKRLEEHRDKIFRSLGIKADILKSECIVREGSAGWQIRQEAKESDADFIVVGTHGATGFRKIFFGTHAWNVIKKSNVPVFAIPSDTMFTGFKNIVFATEYREGELPVINYLVKFAKRFGAELTVLHITNNFLSKELERTLLEQFMEKVQNKVDYTKLSMRTFYSQNLCEGLNNFCLSQKVDLLVMSPEKPFLFEKIFNPLVSETRQMTFHTKIPLLTIPDYYSPENSVWWKMFELDERYMNEDF